VGPGLQLGPGDADGQGEAVAELDDQPRRVQVLVGLPLPPGHLREQLDRLVDLEHVQPDGVGPLQGGERRPAGDQRRRPGAARQQRLHLRLPGSVVEDHQHPPVGDLGPVQVATLLERGRDGCAVDPQRPQEPVEHVGRLESALLDTAEVHVELAVGEPSPDQVGGVGGQGGLADSGPAGDGRDAGGGLPPPARALQDAPHRPQLGTSAGEVGDVRRQLGGGRRRAARVAGVPVDVPAGDQAAGHVDVVAGDQPALLDLVELARPVAVAWFDLGHPLLPGA
jgi:hypothetical protein